MSWPRATLRLQLHRGFTLDDALARLDYFAALGVSHLYTSPITTAQPGSMHGYDTVDYGTVSPELGGEAALQRLADGLHARDMGLVIDIVPNHMGVGGAHNAWWLDILEWGRHSAYARYFDVDWHSPDPALRGKVLMPCLGAQYGDELAAGRIVLRFDVERARFVIVYGEHLCPVCPTDYAPLLQASGEPALEALAASFHGLTTQPDDQQRAASACETLRAHAEQHGANAFDRVLAAHAGDDASGRDRLHRLLERQHYRLAWWRTATDEVNWRRFFDVSALAGVRVERNDVFEAVHRLFFRLYGDGVIDGLRIDHIDGLADPREYCQRLRQRLAGLRPGVQPWVVVEKILAQGETLRNDWPVQGTTGYDFMNDVGALLHDPAGEAPLTVTWAAASGSDAPFARVALDARREVLAAYLAAELDHAARALHRIARDHPVTRDYTYASIHRVVAQIAMQFPIYRIYPVNGMRTALDDRHFLVALEAARRVVPRASLAVLDQVDRWLGARAHDAANTEPQPEHNADTRTARTTHHSPPNAPLSHALVAQRTALTLFSQLSAPLAAKASEDTAFYRYGRLLSRNEVGADPADFAHTVAQFHAANLQRRRRHPHALLATATHDHKRGEDVRARLAVLSERADDWHTALRRWSTLNQPHRRDIEGAEWAPGPGAEAMLYQTLIGCWPPGLDPADADGVHELAERVAQWQTKALREAKQRTNWLAPNEAYEAGCRDFLFDILAPQRREGFLGELAAFVADIAPAGALNSLLQTLLRLSSPGVPDLYQGSELWDFSLVDPDNRRPVDYDMRAAALGAGETAGALLASWRDARIKQRIVQRLLALRARLPALFTEGAYLPLDVQGAHAAQVVAFARRLDDAWFIVIGTRLATPLMDAGQALPHVEASRWKDTAVELPEALGALELTDVLSDAVHHTQGARLLPLRDALATLPVAAWFGESESASKSEGTP